jgi:hypothetical protein
MSVSRKAQRQQAKQAGKPKTPKPKAPGLPVPPELRTEVARLRRRVRYVLLSTTLGGLLLIRFFHEPVAAFLQNGGLAARIGMILVMLAPAMFTWMIGVGQLKDRDPKSSG